MRILVVDDEVLNRRLLEGMLAGGGFEVDEADCGAAALAAVAAGGIDLVLLDVMMPGLDGFEVCRRIREELRLPDLPVVFVTALADRIARIRGKDVGADDFLTKPIDDVELLVRVRSLLRAKASHDLRDQQRRLMGAILDAMDEGVVAADERTGYTLVNRAAERILGPVASWPAPAAWPAGVAEAPLATALAQSASETTLAVSDPAGGTRQLTVSARPLPGGTAQGVVAVFRDVTELCELDRFRSDMSSLVVHDLKNAMLVIGANLEYALDGELPEEAREPLVDARDACDRATRLIMNLMDVSRLEANQLALHKVPIDLAGTCATMVRLRASQLRTRGIALATDVAVPARIEGDLDLLQRVIDNILDNAVRYTPRGGRIVIAATEREGRVRVRIGNTGPAIPVEHRSTVFDKYRQCSPAARSNAGLGLYFCRLAIGAHDGRIFVDSTPELPTVFVIDLPSAASTLSGRLEPRLAG